PIAKLIDSYMKLPGIGGKTATRLAFYTDPDDVDMLQDLVVAAVNDALTKVDEPAPCTKRT
ncbi:hypothetical protein WP50_33640, partial [Lactiplantibacillus plantarum]